MDYSRFNFVVNRRTRRSGGPVPKIGPADKWAAMWGYKPIPSAKSAEEEERRSTSGPANGTRRHTRFSTANSRGADPGELTEGSATRRGRVHDGSD
jgi:hypothetical protein